MTFSRTLVASMLGSLSALVVLVVIGGFGLFAIIAAIIGSAEDRQPLLGESVLELELSGSISESGTGAFSDILVGDWQDRTFLAYLRAIETAATADEVEGIWLNMKGYHGTAAQIEELVVELRQFKESGKWIYATSDDDGFGEAEYILASVADSIFMPHVGAIQFDGYMAVLEFYRPLMEKLNIEPIVVRAGSYKSAVEPFINESPSPEFREVMQGLVDGAFRRAVGIVAEGRGMSPDQVIAIVEEYPLVRSETALRLGMVDAIIYDDEIEKVIARRLGVDEEEIEREEFGDLFETTRVSDLLGYDDRDMFGDAIAVVYAAGSISTGKSGIDPVPAFGGETIGSETFAEAMREAREDDDVRAVVLRVDSPGGGISPSAAMWREVSLTREVKPVVVSMGSLAASGGYYIAAPADHIVADPSTLTGSIGVFALAFNLDGFFEETIGINTEIVKSSPHADLFSGLRDLSDEERAFAAREIDTAYQKFLDVVASGRDMPISRVREIAEGRVWSGEEALELGLVDELGGLMRAIEVAAELAEIENYGLRQLPDPASRLEEMLESMLGTVELTKQLSSGEWMTSGVADALRQRSGLQMMSWIRPITP